MNFLALILRPLQWGFVAAGLLATVTVGSLAIPLSHPPELVSISNGVGAIDRTTGLPPLSRYQARDGSELAYRFYTAADGNKDRLIIMIHGSSGMNELARRLAAENYAVVVPDIRGHGASDCPAANPYPSSPSPLRRAAKNPRRGGILIASVAISARPMISMPLFTISRVPPRSLSAPRMS